MTNQPDPPIHPARWRAVAVSFVAAFALLGFLLATVWQQRAGLDDRVEENLERSHRIETAVDSVRIPLCAVMYAALSRPVVGLTPEQIESRGVYYQLYGPGTDDQPGLRCPLPLPGDR
ncbi:hypothetical protein MXD63_14555 [Frankia sp. Cpl3]|nr:hypothetical protein [Frankia sp. Cpl3]